MPEFPELLAFMRLIQQGRGFPGSLKTYQSLKVCSVWTLGLFIVVHPLLVYCSGHSALLIARFCKEIVRMPPSKQRGLFPRNYSNSKSPIGLVATRMASPFLAAASTGTVVVFVGSTTGRRRAYLCITR